MLTVYILYSKQNSACVRIHKYKVINGTILFNELLKFAVLDKYNLLLFISDWYFSYRSLDVVLYFLS